MTARARKKAKNRTSTEPAPGTCGFYGGVGLNAKPCTHAAGWGTDHEGQGRCREHDEVAEATLQSLKKRYLDALATGDHNMRKAALAVGMGPSQIWRYRQQDPIFDASVRDSKRASDGIRLESVEDDLYERIMDRKAAPSEVIFFLVNRGRGRWRHVARIEHVGDPDHPIEFRKDLDAMSTDEKIEQLKGIVAGHISPAKQA